MIDCVVWTEDNMSSTSSASILLLRFTASILSPSTVLCRSLKRKKEREKKKERKRERERERARARARERKREREREREREMNKKR